MTDSIVWLLGDQGWDKQEAMFTKGHKKALTSVHYLDCCIISQMYTHAKTDEIVRFKCMKFTVCILNVNEAIKIILISIFISLIIK